MKINSHRSITVQPTSIAVRVVLLLLVAQVGLVTTVAAGGGAKNDSSNSNSPSSGGSGASQSGQSTAGSSQGGQGGSSASLGSTVLAYQSLRSAGDVISKEVLNSINLSATDNGQPKKKVLITTTAPNSMGGQAIYYFFLSQYSALTSAYEKRLAPINDEGMHTEIVEPAVGDIASAASQFLTLVRTTATLTENPGAPDPMAIIPNLCNGLRQRGVIPVFVDLSVNGSFVAEANSLTFLLLKAGAQRLRAEAYVSTNAVDSNNPAVKQKASLLKLSNATYDSLSTNLVPATLGNLLNLDYIYTELAKPNTYLLYVTNSYALGQTKVKSNPIGDIFTAGPRIYFAGGGGVAYFLYHGTNMDMVLSARLDGYQGYKTIKSSGCSYIANELK